ncbi:uncharacterized protein LOC119301776 isoform X2 [Triticum dicoccoides]|uniref:uncharacterized protein LOC119301776 isoform X2 n=1 Tax=Triticum dicoccoides TaxID=85692 RepID=UPI000E7979E2|nr:uncharacterized protein LOC119301776 isoform X2 [Triticum dicoccoides]
MAAVSTAQIPPFLTTPTFQSSLLFLPTARRPPTSPAYADRPALAVVCPRPGGTHRTQAAQLVLPACAAASYSSASAAEGDEGMSDPELRLVLELATDDELLELEEILYGTSYFSPVLKSIGKRPNTVSIVALDDIEERDLFISKLESRFLYLAADARSVLRGWRPSYRNVLLQVRRELGVQCSSKLCSADLEAEIFLHLLDEYSSRQKGSFSFPWDKQKSPKENPSIEVNNWKVLSDTAWRIGAKGLESTFLKGGSALTVKTIYESLAKRLSGKLLMETANYEIKKELVKQGGRLAAVNLESRAGLLAARQGLARAASRYVGLRSFMSLLGPIMWGTLLADIVIQMLGTDYARIVQAIYAFAQIRLTRSCYLESHED